jgi:hypothetical protein
VTQASSFLVQQGVFSWALPAGVRIPLYSKVFLLYQPIFLNHFDLFLAELAIEVGDNKRSGRSSSSLSSWRHAGKWEAHGLRLATMSSDQICRVKCFGFWDVVSYPKPDALTGVYASQVWPEEYYCLHYKQMP